IQHKGSRIGGGEHPMFLVLEESLVMKAVPGRGGIIADGVILRCERVGKNNGQLGRERLF
ncbi:hypothetical protein, partial [uncultured Halopseudomonas sp.]|uniref:hypothetical protein n=1 Tax=uncultured Halopseudomonas sp. TaxID=2901193 RepID=UPI0030EB6FDA